MLSDKDIEREQARAEEALERRDQKMEERCGNCRFWDCFDDSEGQCRRYPPQIMKDKGRTPDDWIQPVVHEVDWCGEWQPAREPEKLEGE